MTYMSVLSGKAVLAGDDIDTDIIFPARYLAILDPAEQQKYIFEPYGSEYRRSIIDGGIICAGWNFGCGSSREHAVTSLIGAGVKVVVARSFARIFFRNAINNGLLLVVSPDYEAPAPGSQVQVNLETQQVETNNTPYAIEPVPPFLRKIVRSGGLWNTIN